MTKRIFALMVVCTIFTSLGQIFFKLASSSLKFDLTIFTNYWLFLGLFFYFLGAIMLIISLKKGQLSIVYPLISLSFIWVTIISLFVLNEVLTVNKIVGIAFIFAGITLIGRGSPK
jgi:drug/metabolite transporter (DMT)-like permease